MNKTAREGIDFEIHPRADFEPAQVGSREGFGDQAHRNDALSRHVVDREAHAVDGPTTLWPNEGHELGRSLNVQLHGTAEVPERAHDTDRIDVPRNPVSVNAVAQTQRTLEIECRPLEILGCPAGDFQGLRAQRERDMLGRVGFDRQANAIGRDAIADAKIGEG